jgi:hypothetical protein
LIAVHEFTVIFQEFLDYTPLRLPALRRAGLFTTATDAM